MRNKEGKSEAVILVKAASQIRQKYDESIYCAGVTTEGEWVRLYPVTFEKLEDIQRFGQWARIEFEWQMPADDPRPESRRIFHDSIKIIGELPAVERHDFLSKLEVTGLNDLTEQGKSLAFLRPRNSHFLIERKTIKEALEEKQAYEFVVQQKKLSNSRAFMPFIKSCPYKFKYKYTVDDGIHESTYQNWEINVTFANWSKRYGEEQALARATRLLGEEYPQKSMAFVVSTHSLYPKIWLINAIICMDEIFSMAGHRFDLVV